MHPIFIYIAVFLLLGGIGMYFANRKVDAQTSQQRWFKFFTYIVIVNSAIASILLDYFYLTAILISAIGLGEIIKILAGSPRRSFQLFVVVIYLAIAASFIAFSGSFERFFLLFIYFQVFTFDGFCQVTGQLLGKRKLLPHISPGKTWEGLIGGTIFCVIAAILARDWVRFSTLTALWIGMTTALLAFTGDILASYLKRLCQVKDYSNFLPGHGGVLDRFDSLMMVGTGYVLLSQMRSLP